MAEKFRNKYRIPSARLKNWDYANNGTYFITICTKEMKHFFGKVAEEKMDLNVAGKMAEEYWLEIGTQFPFVELGSFQIMPNHVHGILIVNNSAAETRLIASKNPVDTQFTELKVPSVPTELDGIGGITGENNPMLGDSISKIIRWYKGRCTFEIRKVNSKFGWHPRFHDHIIRNSVSFERIQNYIEENPIRWSEDKFY